MTEFINGIQDFLVNLGFVILGYFFCKYRQKSKQTQSVANEVKQNESANNMKVGIKILNPNRNTTAKLLKRLETNITFFCVMLIWIVFKSDADKMIPITFYAFVVLLVILDSWEREKIIKELRNRYSDLSNHRIHSITDSARSE
jgi:hypothetical protein